LTAGASGRYTVAMTRTPRTLALSFALGIAVAGCATTSAVTRTADEAQLSSEEADRIIKAYEERRTRGLAPANDPLHQPKSNEDLLEILRRDQTDLFADGVKWAEGKTDPKTQTLAAQIEISWGEALGMLAELLERATVELRQEAALYEYKGAVRVLKPTERTRRERVAAQLKELAGIESALRKQAQRHLAKGLAEAEQLMKSAPNDYQSYRIAADFYHLKEDWAKFGEMMKEIETRHPQSNGATFLRGQEQLDRYDNHTKAVELFRQALARDPKFTRAQVAILMAQTSIDGAYRELQKLKELNPTHQIVVWAGPAITERYQMWQARRDERERSREDQSSLPRDAAP